MTEMLRSQCSKRHLTFDPNMMTFLFVAEIEEFLSDMITRKTEIGELEKFYEEEGNKMVLLYGREGAEKEELLLSFAKNKPLFYYRSANASEKQQKELLGKKVETDFNVKLADYNYEEFFNRIRSGNSDKLVLIIDEFQYLVKKDEEFLLHVLKLKKKQYYPGPVLIILATSSLVWVNKDVPLLPNQFEKQFDGRIMLKDYSFLDVVRNFPKYSTSESVQLYGIIGGVPEYIRRWDGEASIKENVIRHILSPDGFLFSAAESYIASELRELAVYQTILSSLASGNNKLNDLFLDTGFSRAKISVYMKNLMEFEVIEKVVSFETGGWENTKKGVYRISNTFVNFWFHFIYPHLSELYTLTPEKFYERYIERELDGYLTRYFIDVCSEYLELLNQIDQLPIKVAKMGTWIGKKGNIDIIAQNHARNSIVSLCSWTGAQISAKMVDELKDRMKLAHVSADYLYLFSARGFDMELSAMAEKDSSIVLIDMNEL